MHGEIIFINKINCGNENNYLKNWKKVLYKLLRATVNTSAFDCMMTNHDFPCRMRLS